MIQPINNYVQIEPLVHEDFVQSEKTTYDEVGIVISVTRMMADSPRDYGVLQKGMKVYFDSWTAAKFPNGDGFYWLVPFANIKAYEIPE